MKTRSIKNSIEEYFFLNSSLKLKVRQIERHVKELNEILKDKMK